MILAATIVVGKGQKAVSACCSLFEERLELVTAVSNVFLKLNSAKLSTAVNEDAYGQCLKIDVPSTVQVYQCQCQTILTSSVATRQAI